MAKQASTNLMYIATSASGKAALFRKPQTANAKDQWMPLSKLDPDTMTKIAKKTVASGTILYVTADEWLLREKGFLGPAAQ